MNKQFLLSVMLVAALSISANQIQADDVDRIVIQRGNTLSQLVKEHYDADANQRQLIMQAILRRNPNAFIDQSIHLMHTGETLVLPSLESVKELGEEITASNPEALGQLTDAQERIDALNKERDTLSTQLKAVEAENQALKKTVEEFVAENNTLNGTLAKLEGEIESLQSQLAQREATQQGDSSVEIEAIRNQLIEFTQANDTLRDENVQIQAQLDDAKEQLAEGARVSSLLRQEITDLRTENNNLQTKLSKAHADLAAGEESANQADASLQTELAEVKAKLAAKETEIFGLNEQLEAKSQDLLAATQAATVSEADSESTSWLDASGKSWWWLLLLLPLLWLIWALRTDPSPDSPTIPQGKKGFGSAADQTRGNSLPANDEAHLVDKLASSGKHDALEADENIVSLRPDSEPEAPISDQMLSLPSEDAFKIDSPMDEAGQSVDELRPNDGAESLAQAFEKVDTEAVPDASDVPTVTERINSDADLYSADDQEALSTNVTDANNDTVADKNGATQTEAEVQVKLDIALAYLDLRDVDGASEILKEVLSDGTADQKRQAQEILGFLS